MAEKLAKLAHSLSPDHSTFKRQLSVIAGALKKRKYEGDETQGTSTPPPPQIPSAPASSGTQVSAASTQPEV
jgi:hypothetical protein